MFFSLFITENPVRSRNFREFFVAEIAIGISIWMIIDNKLVEFFLDLFSSGVRRYFHDPIEIIFHLFSASRNGFFCGLQIKHEKDTKSDQNRGFMFFKEISGLL